MKYLLENQESERIIFRKIKKSDFNDWLVFHKNPITSQYWISELKSPEIECKIGMKNNFIVIKMTWEE